MYLKKKGQGWVVESNSYQCNSNIYKCEKLYPKKENFGIYFSIVHISLDFTLRNMKFLVSVDECLRILIYVLVFVLCKKKRATIQLFFAYFFFKIS